MEYCMVCVPAAPVRRKPKHQREMVNQLLFGDTVKILKQRGDLWVKVRSLPDNYEGWMTRTLLEEIPDSEAKQSNEFLASGLLNTIAIGAVAMNLPMGSSLPGFDNGKGRFGKTSYQFNGSFIKKNEQQPGGILFDKLTEQWLNAPYLWGGKTMFGVDCSGFAQVNFRMMGIDLPRDAWQQAQEGKVVKKLKDAKKGDLAFFDDKDEIVHVGILLSPEQIIHASGKVRIDTIDNKGIINGDSGKRTHQLKAIKRYW